MADDDRSIRVRLLADISNYVDGLKKAAVATGTFGKEVSGHGKAVKADVERVGHTALLMSAGVAAGLALSAKAAVDWESAWTGVTKTVDGTTAQMADLEEGLRSMANELPATHGEIAAVAEAAGALGIGTAAVEGFTKTMIDLGETTDLTADQAATAFARIANVMGTSQRDFDRMGSTIVALGNEGASTEAEIAEFAQRLAAAGSIAGLSEADVFAFAETLAAVGVEAEAGGTAFSKVFTSIRDAVLDGSEKLDTFAKVAGVSVKEFSSLFREDAAGAITLFVEGLGGISAAGESTTAVFQELELTDQRLMRALLSTGQAGDYLRDQIELASQAWEENNALTLEAEKRYDTFAAKAEMARNQLVNFGIDIGNQLLPALSGILDVLSSVATGFGELDGAAGTAVTALALVAGGGTGLIGVLGTFGPKVKQFRDSLQTMGSLGSLLASNLGKATLALGAVGLAVGVYTYVLGKNEQRKREAIDLSKLYADAIREETGALNENIDAVTAQKLGEFAGSDKLRELGADFDVLLGGIRETGDGLATLSSEFKVGQLAGEFSRELEAAGLAGTVFGDELQRLHDEMGSSEFDDFLGLLAELGIGYEDGAVLAANLDAAQSGVADSAHDAAGGQRQFGEDLGLTTEEAEAAEEAIRGLLDAYRASVDPLFGMLDALDRNREAQRAQAEAAAEGAERIADAQSALADAQGDLAAARAEDDPEATARAAERVAEAEQNLADVRADAAITAEEATQFNRDAAQSALDVEVAARELAIAIENGTVSAEAAKGMLAEWVEQGLLTEEQAKNVASQFDAATAAAEGFAGDWVANAIAHTAEAEAAITRLREQLEDLYNDENLSPADRALAARFVSWQLSEAEKVGGATGGVVGTLGAAQPSDVVQTWLTPGEGIVNLKGMSLLGPAGLDALNSGRLSDAGSYSSMTTDARDQSRTWAPTFVVPDKRAAGDIEFRMRRIALEAGV